MKKGTLALIEQTLFDYRDVDEYIKDYLKEIEYSRPDEAGTIYAMTIADDLRLTNMRHVYKTLDLTLDKLEPIEKRIIELYYFNRQSWEYITKEVEYTKRACFKIRRKVIKMIADNLGLLI